MRIIKQGKMPGAEVYQAECAHCSTEIEFSRSEASFTSDPRDGDYLSIGCPTCKREITVGVRVRSHRGDY
jgi:hypothetical protein